MELSNSMRSSHACICASSVAAGAASASPRVARVAARDARSRRVAARRRARQPRPLRRAPAHGLGLVLRRRAYRVGRSHVRRVLRDLEPSRHGVHACLPLRHRRTVEPSADSGSGGGGGLLAASFDPSALSGEGVSDTALPDCHPTRCGYARGCALRCAAVAAAAAAAYGEPYPASASSPLASDRQPSDPRQLSCTAEPWPAAVSTLDSKSSISDPAKEASCHPLTSTPASD
mmetsp:Transcript_5277/g.13504  ORF Transcript_5277/g.13504 Transcript_5277/m.13504 type:complete len:232 (-) Transcript_5277:81-776(-)